MPQIKAVLFDFMGTCLDWHSSIVSALPQSVSEDERSRFALEWRQTYFDYNAARLAAGQPPEDIDISHRRTLSILLSAPEWSSLKQAFSEAEAEAQTQAQDGGGNDDAGAPTNNSNNDVVVKQQQKQRIIAAWHAQPAWSDVAPALAALRARGYETLVHANGTTRLQLDLVRSSGLRGLFDVLFSSELLGVLKPAPESYRRGLDLLRYAPEECVMVAAHAYDTRGAKEVGMRTVYVYRWTDDIREDQSVVRGEHDVYLEGMEGLVEAVTSFG